MDNNFGPELQKHNNKFLEEDKKEKEHFELQCNGLEQQLKEIKSQIQSMKQQSALDDNIIFNNDIVELHDNLENYVTNLKPKIDVNINEVKKLLIKYGCQSKISDKDPNKPLIKAVLQRHVLEEILVQLDFYFSRSNGIVYKTNLMDQQFYTTLGIREFRTSDGVNFIYIISKKINKMMNKYRKINDIKRKKFVNSLAKDLVINVVKIFYFSLLIQKPVAQYRWFNNNEKINKSYMKGGWNEDEIEDLVVEICSFPLILKPTYPDGFKVCTPAKVFPLNLGMSVGRRFKNIM